MNDKTRSEHVSHCVLRHKHHEAVSPVRWKAKFYASISKREPISKYEPSEVEGVLQCGRGKYQRSIRRSELEGEEKNEEGEEGEGAGDQRRSRSMADKQKRLVLLAR
ncbi:hypothetical protein E2C01_055141 [Portunus trituberculatus]|uniref:Uncharacterized protein n=1 Tax=Portunus trituberculatus TaxID=210409 RepID=A0A5B7GVT6_PORTR|nr:hypothetical protein [Portunus trituberculatus]